MKQSFSKYLIIFICFYIFCFSSVYASTDFEKEIDRLSKEIAEKISSVNKKKVAVVDFNDLNGSVTELGRFIAEEFSVSLAGASKGFTVVDRTHLKTILQEHKLSSTGLIDPQTARQLGKVAGVEALVTGTLTPLGESVRISVKVLDTETAVLIDASRGNIAMTDAIKNLQDREIITSEKQGVSGTNRRLTVTSKHQVEEENFVFQALDCVVTNKSAICSVLITNKENDRRIFINFRDTCMIDDFGTQYPVRKIQIGGTVGSSSWFSFDKMLFSNIPTRVFLTFEDVSPQATFASGLVLDCRYRNKDYQDKKFSAKLRNIPFSKK